MRSDTLSMLERLVSFPTVSKTSNLELIDFVEKYLAQHGVSFQRIPSICGNKASLIACIGPAVSGGIVLSGHSDVVPVEGQSWLGDPWRLASRDGRLYGRGTCDMKGFVAIALARIPEMTRMDLSRPVLLALSHDEELGCAGAEELVSTMKSSLPDAAAVIVGEPTMMKIVSAHKGMLGFRTTVHGYEVHSSRLQKGVSAVMSAAELIAWHSRQNEKNALAISARGAPSMFDVPFTTLHVGTVTGGTALNITARQCEFVTDIRTLPGEDLLWKEAYLEKAAEVSGQIGNRRPEARVEVSQFIDVPSLDAVQTSPAIELAKRLTGEHEEFAVSYATEAGFFQRHGYPVVVCGPGSIENAHQPDEFISISQIDQGERLLDGVLDSLKA